jgi:hypothetical protein
MKRDRTITGTRYGCPAKWRQYQDAPEWLYRWDAEWDYWTSAQRRLVQQVFQGWNEGEPFPPLGSIRPKVK